jgi:hypothetical protein
VSASLSPSAFSTPPHNDLPGCLDHVGGGKRHGRRLELSRNTNPMRRMLRLQMRDRQTSLLEIR